MTAVREDFIEVNLETRQLLCRGEWNLTNISDLKSAFETLSLPIGEFTMMGEAITKMDSAGAWILGKWLKNSDQKGLKIQLKNFSEQAQKLLSFIEKKGTYLAEIPKIQPLSTLAKLGKLTFQQLIEMRHYLAFTGYLAIESLRLIRNPTHFRWSAIASTIDKTGYTALSIIALLSFMIGVVIAYQMGFQLRNYGANVFIVDLLGLSVLREFGPLLTSIMVAGRTGSSFTAQLGIMKINQEIDALDTMGVTPAELLLLPRLAGLFITLPLLTIWSDIFGIMGGMLMANNMLGVSWHDFLVRFQRDVPLRALLIGLGKAPVFALLIASIGCFEGTQVEGSADSVGSKTTQSVVLAIFFIIVADAIFSIIFSKLKL